MCLAPPSTTLCNASPWRLWGCRTHLPRLPRKAKPRVGRWRIQTASRSPVGDLERLLDELGSQRRIWQVTLWEAGWRSSLPVVDGHSRFVRSLRRARGAVKPTLSASGRLSRGPYVTSSVHAESLRWLLAPDTSGVLLCATALCMGSESAQPSPYRSSTMWSLFTVLAAGDILSAPTHASQEVCRPAEPRHIPPRKA